MTTYNGFSPVPATQYSLGFDSIERERRLEQRGRRAWRHSVYRAAAAVGLDCLQAEFAILQALLWGPRDAATSAEALAPGHSGSRARAALRALERWGLVERRRDFRTRGRGSASSIAIKAAGVADLAGDVDNHEAAETLFLLKPTSGLSFSRATNGTPNGTPNGTVENEVAPIILGNKDIHGPRTEAPETVDRGHADHKVLVSASPPVSSSTARVTIAVSDCEDTAAKIFARCGYAGDQGQTLWKAAAAFKAGLIPENALASAVTAVAAVKPRNPPAYFRTVLAESCGLSLGDLGELLRRVRIAPLLPGGPPQRQRPPDRPPTFRTPPAAGETNRDRESAINARRNAYLAAAESN